MAQKSSGARHGTRRKLKGERGNRGTISSRLQQFSEGERVRIAIDSSVQKGMPHPRFHGRDATVVETNGTTCVIALTDGGKRKTFSVRTVHLKGV